MLVSYKFFALNQTTYLISLCKDFKIRVWCLKTQQCIHIEDLVKHIRSNTNISWNECRIDVSNTSSEARNAILSVLISTNEEFRISNLLVGGSGADSFTLAEISKRIIQKNGGELIDLCLTSSKTWVMYKNEDDTIAVLTIPFYENSPIEIHMMDDAVETKKTSRHHQHHHHQQNQRNFESESEMDEDNQDNRLIEMCTSEMDLKETYLKLIFEPYRFSKMNILKSLGVSVYYYMFAHFEHIFSCFKRFS